MISPFGNVMRKIREEVGDSLRSCASKLEISATFLSAMENGRKSIPTYYPNKIKVIYNLNESYYIELFDSMIETNNHIDIEINNMNEAQIEISKIFARKIENADDELIEKLKIVLNDNKEAIYE